MSEVTSEITENKLYKELTSGDSTLILSRLNEIDTLNNITPIILDILKQVYQNEKKLIIRFLIKKSLRLAIGKVKKIPLNVDLNLFESLLKDPNRIDDLALATYSVDTETAFSIAKKLRDANWQNFATEILPVFCRFFKHYGSFEDVETLLELTKHINSVVVISAIDALETIDSTKLQGIVESLLSSTSSDMRLKAIQVYYRWNKKDAMDKFSEMLFSENSKDKSLAIFHSEFFQFSDVEPLLIKVIPNINNKYDLINLMQVFVKNVYVDLPLKIFLANKHLEGEQQNLVKGLMLSIIRELNRKSLIKCSIQDYLAELKEKAKGVITEKVSDNTTQAQTDDSSDVIESPENKDELPVNGEIPFVLEIQEGSIPNLEDNNLKDFESLSEKKKIRFLSKINQEYFRQNYNRLKEYYNKSKDKILASFIVLFGKYGDKSEIDNIRQYCSSDNPDIICACIKALSRLDTDYLCLYLPKYLQNSNGKIRMTAVRICARINIEQVKNVLLDMITSENVNQRAIGVSTALLVDFSIVKEPLLLALEKEKNNDLIKSICDVLASNPDKDILYKIYKFSRTNKTVESKLMQEILETISEKLAVRLKQLQTSQQLIKDAETAFANETEDKKIQNLSSSTNQQEIAVKAPQELNTYVKKDNMANTENTTEQKTAANNTKVYVKKENATNTQPLKTPSENKKVSVQTLKNETKISKSINNSLDRQQGLNTQSNKNETKNNNENRELLTSLSSLRTVSYDGLKLTIENETYLHIQCFGLIFAGLIPFEEEKKNIVHIMLGVCLSILGIVIFRLLNCLSVFNISENRICQEYRLGSFVFFRTGSIELSDIKQIGVDHVRGKPLTRGIKGSLWLSLFYFLQGKERIQTKETSAIDGCVEKTGIVFLTKKGKKIVFGPYSDKIDSDEISRKFVKSLGKYLNIPVVIADEGKALEVVDDYKGGYKFASKDINPTIAGELMKAVLIVAVVAAVLFFCIYILPKLS